MRWSRMASAFINTGGKSIGFVLQITLHARRAEIWRSQMKPCQMGKGCLFAGLGHCVSKLCIAAYKGDVSTALCKGHEHFFVLDDVLEQDHVTP